MFSWMVWTTPVAIFFAAIGVLLAGMTVWEVVSPSVLRKGFLPMVTSRGDRLFIGLNAAAWINLIWIGLGGKIMTWFSLADEPTAWPSFAVSVLAVALIMRRG